MTDAPSPYAPPAAAPDERAAPRPAGRAAVFLVATFVVTFVGSALWQTWFSRSPLITGFSSSMQLASVLFSIAGVLILLWAYLSDAVPLWGTRRESYLMLAFLMMAAVWVALAIASHHRLTWLTVVAPFGVAGSMSRAAIAGGLTEIGQRRGATGRLAAANIGLSRLATLTSWPLAVWSTWSAFSSIALAGGVAAGLCVAVVLMTATLSDDGAPARAPEPRVGIPTFLRSRPFWATIPLLVCAGLANVPDELMTLELNRTFGDRASLFLAQWQTPAITIATVAVYFLVCRYVRFAALLRIALLINAIALALCAVAFRDASDATLQRALMAGAVGDGLLSVAILDLAMRLAPTGREAFGVLLLAGLPNVLSAVVAGITVPIAVPVEHVAWFAMGAAIAAAIAVALLPRSTREMLEGRVIGSPA